MAAKKEPELDEFGGTIGQGSVRTIRAPFERRSVPRIRQALVADLKARGVSEQVVDESELVAAELVGNSLRHASALLDGTVRIRWKEKNGVVEIEVTDAGGDTVPHPAPQAAWVSAGRGLRIVRSLAHEWGVISDERGNVTVWASLGGPSRRRSS